MRESIDLGLKALRGDSAKTAVIEASIDLGLKAMRGDTTSGTIFFFIFFLSSFSAICLSHFDFEILLNHFMPYKTFFLRCLATLLCFYQAILSYFYLHINIFNIFHMYYVCVLINSESYVETYVEDV